MKKPGNAFATEYHIECSVSFGKDAGHQWTPVKSFESRDNALEQLSILRELMPAIRFRIKIVTLSATVTDW